MRINHGGFFFLEYVFLYFLAGIGVVATVSPPLMTDGGILERDSQRIQHLSEIARMIDDFSVENGVIPTESDTGCVPSKVLSLSGVIVPIDPANNNTPPCAGDDGMTYAYRVITDSKMENHYILSSLLEAGTGGNLPGSIDGYSDLEIEKIFTGTGVSTGSYYVIYK